MEDPVGAHPETKPIAAGSAEALLAKRAALRSLPRYAMRLGALVLGMLCAGLGNSTVSIPLVCSRGPEGQEHRVSVTAPRTAKLGSTYTVRIDGTNSGTISHAGLNYIFDMVHEWPVPTGARYVEGSARIVPGTGSENVRSGAYVVHHANAVVLVLPAHVDDGASYTAPSFEFVLQATGAPGTIVTQSFARFSLKANAFLVGNVSTICEASPRPYPVAITQIEPDPGIR